MHAVLPIISAFVIQFSADYLLHLVEKVIQNFLRKLVAGFETLNKCQHNSQIFNEYIIAAGTFTIKVYHCRSYFILSRISVRGAYYSDVPNIKLEQLRNIEYILHLYNSSPRLF